jgi:hypothetical protein
MRIQTSSVVTIFVALLIVSGTTGCITRVANNPWYSPKGYTMSNPFSNGKGALAVAPPFKTQGQQIQKPSLAETPTNIREVPGGYTRDTGIASRTPAPARDVPSNTTFPQDQPWRDQPSPMMSHSPTGVNDFGRGYSEVTVTPSHYPQNHNGVAPVDYQQYRGPGQPALAQHGQPGTQYPMHGGTYPMNNYQSTTNYSPNTVGPYGGSQPNNTPSQPDPYSGIQSPPATPPGFSYEQPGTSPFPPFHNGGPI